MTFETGLASINSPSVMQILGPEAVAERVTEKRLRCFSELKDKKLNYKVVHSAEKPLEAE